jgi:hypothetical protein
MSECLAGFVGIRRHVPFRRPWEPSQALQPWEGAFSGSFRRLPQEPTVAAERRAAIRVWRERQRARKAAQAASPDAAAGTDVVA